MRRSSVRAAAGSETQQRFASGGFAARLNLALDLRFELIARNLQVIILMHAEPEFGRSAEIARESERRLARDTASALYDLRDPVGRNMQLFGELVHAHAEWLEKFFQQNLARMNRRQLFGPAHRWILRKKLKQGRRVPSLLISHTSDRRAAPPS